MPCELLFEQQQVLAKMMGPAGCGTPVQALWVSLENGGAWIICLCSAGFDDWRAFQRAGLHHARFADNTLPCAVLVPVQLLVRAPQLRHASEASLRTSLRQLHRLVSHTDIERPAVLTAVYKFPWIVEAMEASTQPAPAAAAADLPQHQHSAAPAAAPAAAAAHRAGAQAPATWSQELAAVILELQQADYAEFVAAGAQGSRGLRMSPAFASGAVRTYLAFGEAKQAVCAATSAAANRLLQALPGPNYPPAAVDAYTCKQHASSSDAGPHGMDADPAASPTAAVPSPQHAPVAAAEEVTHSTFDAAASGVAEVMHQLQQQHLLLQQLLAACPHLTVLPPELLLARYHRLESVVEGSAESAQRLVAANPFLLVSHADRLQAAAPAGPSGAQGLRPSYA